MPHLFFSYFNFKKCEFGIYNTQIKTFLMVSLVFFDSEQLLIHKQTPKNASKYPKLACAKIAILHPAAFRGLKMCENQFFFTRSKHRIYHKYGIGIYVKFHHRL